MIELNMWIVKVLEIFLELLLCWIEVKERFGFICDIYYYIMDVVEGVFEGNGFFGFCLKEKLVGLIY